MIKKYINKIHTDRNFDYYTGNEVVEYAFYGDGQGDFEDSSNKTTEKCLNDYIEECRIQIDLANKCLENFNVSEDFVDDPKQAEAIKTFVIHVSKMTPEEQLEHMRKMVKKYNPTKNDT